MSREDELLYTLDVLANLPEDTAHQTDVTLLVNGSLIVGYLASRKQYLENAEFVDDKLDLINTLANRSLITAEDKKGLPSKDESFIHLQNAYYVVGGQYFPSSTTEGLYIRVRRNDVNAFSIGRILPTSKSKQQN